MPCCRDPARTARFVPNMCPDCAHGEAAKPASTAWTPGGRSRRERPHHELVEKPVARRHDRAVAVETMTLFRTNYTSRCHGSFLGEYPPVDPPGGGFPRGALRRPVNRQEVVREIYTIDDPDLAEEFVTRLWVDLQDLECPPGVRQLSRTIVRWSAQVSAWHRARVHHGREQPGEAAEADRVRVHPASPTTRSGSYSMSASPTGTYSPPSDPTEFRRAPNPTTPGNSYPVQTGCCRQTKPPACEGCVSHSNPPAHDPLT